MITNYTLSPFQKLLTDTLPDFKTDDFYFTTTAAITLNPIEIIATALKKVAKLDSNISKMNAIN